VDGIDVISLCELGDAEARQIAFCGPEAPQTSAERMHFRSRLVARLIARGLNNREIAAATNITPARICILRRDPAIRELAAAYQELVVEELMEPRKKIEDAMLQALDIVQEHMDAGQVPLGHALAVFKTTADRCGHAPVQKQMNLSGHLSREQLAAIVGGDKQEIVIEGNIDRDGE